MIERPQRDLWLPCLIGAVGLLVCLAIWGALVADRRERLRLSAVETAEATATVIELGLAHHLAVLEGLAARHRDFGRGAAEAWQALVDERLDHASGLVSVELVEAPGAGGGQGADSAREPAGAPRPSVAPRVAPQVEGPFEDEVGRARYRIVLPVAGGPGGADRLLVGHFEVVPFLETVLRARASGYALEVFAGEGRLLHARGQPSQDPWQSWWRAEGTISLPLGGTWRVVLRPTPEYAAARLSPIPHYLLVAGVVLSLVLALLAHELRVVGRQSRVLAASHRAVAERGVELERRVAERTEALEEVVAELEAFNQSVSHDLRSPLGAILNFVAILEEDFRGRVLDDEGMAIVARIERSASRATALLEDLLKLSRAGRADLTLERIDMNALVVESFAQVRAAQNDDDVELVAGPLPAAHGDAALLGAVLANLFSNAFKYSRGCPKRRVEVTGRIEGRERLYTVADNGRGFDMRYVDKLFGLFERLHAGDDVEGTGVGLAIVRRIVRRHGGRVWAEGSPGEGARFSFALPDREVA